MTPTALQVKKDLLALPEHERAEVIHQGLLSLDHAGDGTDTDDSAEEVDAAWRDEISNRIDDILNGKVQMTTIEESYARFLEEHPSAR